jgi:phthalate 4,5-cis-dihydrodiol dehydrogenase
MAPIKPLKLGVIGLGQGAACVLPTMDALPEIELVAGADPNPQMRAGFTERYPGVRAYDDVEKLLNDSAIEAVWIATPNRFHCAHTVAALEHGKHVAIEKPMSVTIEEADRMIEAAHRNDRKLLAAHTSAYGLPVRAMRKLSLAGGLGSVRAILIWSFTDWMLRPRSADELSPEGGQGIVHRQGPHQIDVVRLLGGGKLRSVRGTSGRWMREREIPGFYTAYLEFEDGTPATIVHNGYGYFMTAELYPWALETWRYTDDDRIAMRRAMRDGVRDEEFEKQEFRIGGRRDPTLEVGARDSLPWSPIDLGMLLVSCDRGDMRHSKFGVSVYGDDGRREIDLRGVGRQEIDLERGVTIPALVELYEAVRNGTPVYHSGEWARATLEATLAIIASTRERGEIRLQHQVAMPPEYDADFEVPGATLVEA